MIMLSANFGSLDPVDPKCDPALLKILRWLVADRHRILPQPDDEVGIGELARAINRSPDHTRAMMAWSYGARPDIPTRPLLTLEGFEVSQ
jgi:hypothetical protein